MCSPKTDKKWKNMLIKSPKLIMACTKGYIQFCDTSIRLLNQSKISHRQDELFTYFLWVEKFKENSDIFPGFYSSYMKSRCTDETPFISIIGEYLNKIKCEIKIEAFTKKQ